MKHTRSIISGGACLHIILAVVSPLQGLLDRPGVTHEFCNRQALDILQSDGFAPYAGFLRRFQRELNLGVYWADKGWKNIHHYYEPGSGRGLWHFANALDQFEAYWRLALSALRQADPRKAVFWIGAAAHLTQDLCVPHHARARMLDGHKQYEEWAEKHCSRYAVSAQGVYGEGRAAGSLLMANAAVAADFLDMVVREDDETSYHQATAVLLPLAQRTTAGLLRHFAGEAEKAGIRMKADDKSLAVA